MSKKKLFLVSSILLAVILAFQIYTLATYDHFAAVGGRKIISKVEYSDVVGEYALKSVEYDVVLKDAIQSHNLKGGDFLTIIAESNKRRLKRPLVQLFKYKNIEELSLDSEDDEVVDFLRQDLNERLDEMADFVQRRVQEVLKTSAIVHYDDADLTMTVKLPEYVDNLDSIDFTEPTVNIGFYRVVPWREFNSFWNPACEQTDPDHVKDESLPTSGIYIKPYEEDLRQTLSNSVYWIFDGNGIVQDKNKECVDSMIHTEAFNSSFPDYYRLSWSEKTNDEGQGDIWHLFVIEIPENGVPEIGNSDIQSAELKIDEFGKHVGLQMNPAGTDKWSAMTMKNIDGCIAILVDGVVISAPKILGVIQDGNTQISGGEIETLKRITKSINFESPKIILLGQSESVEKGNPPFLSVLFQQILLVVSIILFLFLTLQYIRIVRFPS